MKNINYTKLSERTIKWLFILYSVIITIQYLLDAISDNFNKAGIIANISTFGYSDWFINFQAGFVRRGIIGELLILLYNNFNIDVSHAIMAIVITSTTALILCMIYMFRKKGLSLYLLPSILFFGGFAINGLIIYRRDALNFWSTIFLQTLYDTVPTKVRNLCKGHNDLSYVQHIKHIGNSFT